MEIPTRETSLTPGRDRKLQYMRTGCRRWFWTTLSLEDGQIRSAKFLPAQLQEWFEPAVQDQSYVICSPVFLTHAQKYEEILFFKRIFCISIARFIQDLKGLYIQSLSAIPITLMLIEKLVIELRRIHPGDLTPYTLS